MYCFTKAWHILMSLGKHIYWLKKQIYLVSLEPTLLSYDIRKRTLKCHRHVTLLPYLIHLICYGRQSRYSNFFFNS